MKTSRFASYFAGFYLLAVLASVLLIFVEAYFYSLQPDSAGPLILSPGQIAVMFLLLPWSVIADLDVDDVGLLFLAIGASMVNTFLIYLGVYFYDKFHFRGD